MRIGLIAPPWIPVPPPNYGGTEAVVHTLAAGLASAGHDVLLAAAEDSTCPVPRVPGLASSSAVTIDSARQEILHVVKSYDAMSEVDLVHDHTLLGPLYRNRNPHIPTVTTMHGPFDEELTLIYRAACIDTSLVAISHHQASTAQNIHVDQVIHHGIEVDNVPFNPTGGDTACFLGRMTPDKGVEQAILIARQAGIPLRVAAKVREAPEHEYFHEVIEPMLGPDVEFIGELRTDEKYKLLGESALLINPIQWDEPFGMVMIEALSTGTPVLSTTRGSAPEIIEEGVTGYFRNSVEELAAAVDSCRQLSREACRAAVEQRFSAKRMVDDYLRFYASMLRKSVPLSGGTAEDSGDSLELRN
jgi:glycosyltransferase involved in cell wall biosynthesis